MYYIHFKHIAKYMHHLLQHI